MSYVDRTESADCLDTSLSSLRSVSIRRVRGNQAERVTDVVAVEEPLDIRISYWFKEARISQSLAVAMRTPGNDRELTAGLLLAEGVVSRPSDIVEIRHLGAGFGNEILAELAPHLDVETWRLQRNTFLNSSCGICGKASCDAIAPMLHSASDNIRISPELLYSLPGLLAERQRGFAQTGGLHAAALINTRGEIVQLYEDIGRHNALDKLLGWCLLQGRLPLADAFLFLSSRSSFELVQKSIMAGGSILATVGGPSSLAIETARQFGITLVSFVRDRRCNVYSGEWRIDL